MLFRHPKAAHVLTSALVTAFLAVSAGAEQQQMFGRLFPELPPYDAPDDTALLAEAERHIARYKLPKAFVYVPEVVRSPSGKADYRWARQLAEKAASAT